MILASKGFARAKDTPRRRPQRVAEILRAEISNILFTKFRDPRVDSQFVTITEVNVSPDLKNAKVYFSTMKTDIDISILTEVIINSASFFRSQLSHRLQGGYGVPELHFIYDNILDQSMKIDELIDIATKNTSK